MTYTPFSVKNVFIMFLAKSRAKVVLLPLPFTLSCPVDLTDHQKNIAVENKEKHPNIPNLTTKESRSSKRPRFGSAIMLEQKII